MYKIVFPLFFLFSVACNNSNKPSIDLSSDSLNDSHAIDSLSIKDKIDSNFSQSLDLVSSLEEVEDLRNMVDKITNGQNHIRLTADTLTYKNKSYYWVKVMEDNGESLVTQMNFCVNPNTSEVLYYDVMEDTAMTLADWRKK